jgi:factor associated with neutral sphingomyelinase activation
MIQSEKSSSRMNDIYLEDFECTTRRITCQFNFRDQLNGQPKTEGGQLLVNSKSLVFESFNENTPLLKFLYRNLEEFPAVDLENPKRVNFKAKRVVEIQTRGPPSPYLSHDISLPEFRLFSFVVSDKQNAFLLLQWIKKLSEVADIEHLIEDPLYYVTQLMIDSMERIDFDRSNLESVNESFQFKEDILVQRIQPMHSSYCLIYLTNKNFYYREINAFSSKAITRVSLKKIRRVLKRRYQLKYLALEFQTDNESYYFNFREEFFRNKFYEVIVSLISPSCLTENSLHQLTELWVSRLISNYDYLISLNMLAQRSFNDLSQYPVFPWILVDFDSPVLDFSDRSIYRDLKKPIGALNKTRLDFFKRRYREMPDEEKFLYGTHYSTPGYVVGYLVRSHPLYMLRLQNGRFDAPDRLFYSIKKDWKNCYEHFGCVKELIPEFFMNSTDFLVNSLNLNLGTRQNKKQVGDVKLPKWASGSPEQFLRLHREGCLISVGKRICLGRDLPLD